MLSSDGPQTSAMRRAMGPGHDADADMPSQPVPRPGMLVAERFLIESELGSGSMGIVFAARDQHMGGRRVALKWLRTSVLDARSAAARFLREALASVEHTNVVRIYDVDVERPFIVMELLEGESLAERMSAGELAIQDACDIVLQTLDGLSAVHTNGLIHRDLKPENIFLTRDKAAKVIPKILDFGLVKLTTTERSRWTTTAVGTVVGTPAYMAPEQLRGCVVDARADLYALAVVLYEMITRRLPYVGRTAVELGVRVLEGNAIRPSGFRPALPASVERVIMKGMSVEPAERWQTAAEMAAALRDAMRGATPRHTPASARRSSSLWAGAGMLLAGALLVSMCSTREPEKASLQRTPPPLPAAPDAVKSEPVEPPERDLESADSEVALAARRLEALLPAASVGERDVQAEFARAVKVGMVLDRELERFSKELEREVAEAVREGAGEGGEPKPSE